jgi:hypothetical protein
MPLSAGVSTANTVYAGNAGAKKVKDTRLIVGIGIALVAVVAVTLVVRGGGEKELTGGDTLVAPVSDGWRNFTAPDGAFTVAFPGTPEQSESAIGALTDTAQRYSMKDGDFVFGVVVSGARSYVAPHEAGKKLEEWMRPTYEGKGAVIEATAQVNTPRGDQAYDLVFVLGNERTWARFTTWGGNLIMVYASLAADKQPTAAQSQTYSRLRDSVHQ